MKGSIERDNETLIEFWDGAFAVTEEEKAQLAEAGADDWTELAPSRKLLEAARSLGSRRRVLDCGCGSGWASVAAAKSGCPSVTAADTSKNAVAAAELYARAFGVELNGRVIAPDWLSREPEGFYDGMICSNVLDVVPEETAEEMIRGLARAASRGASVIIGLNYYLSPEAAAARGMELEDGRRLYVDGVLRLVSRTDEEWAELFIPYFELERLEHFAWPGEQTETRRLYYLIRR